MRFNRMMAIVLLLVSKRKITIQALADFLEVSPRTIYRDLEALDYAGVPIISTPGYNGGISIVDSYYLDKQLFSSLDFKYVLLSLYRLNIQNDNNKNELVSKLQLLFDEDELRQIEHHARQVVVDFSDWQGIKTDDARFMLIQEAIQSHHKIAFTYTKHNGDKKHRHVEPYQLLFKSGRWYLHAVDDTIAKFFLLERIKDVELKERFVPDAENYQQDFYWQSDQLIEFVLRIDRSVLHIFDAWQHVDVLEEGEDWLRLKIIMEDNHWLETFILGLGEMAKVESPQALVERISTRVNGLYKNYF
ncbi:helix-turn-helix transcriptional regulator [Culicoidibacter larvae]|uniref:YafY family transcriptional regulator n=1 Tax=Culicoidibacter larvae TaxID=2579976 RepID=A0A5R8QA83_9FIRM|nr:YafY family protein [Culicoidibacter larvae]TLG72545.1 YafY family transcriptional regulator [Culicoidibacter larvae]